MDYIKEYEKWSGHPYKDLASDFHTNLIAFAKHCNQKLEKRIEHMVEMSAKKDKLYAEFTHKATWTRQLKEAICPHCDGSGEIPFIAPGVNKLLVCKWCEGKEKLLKL